MKEIKKDNLSFIEENKLVIFLFTILLSGVLVGSITFRSFDINSLEDLSIFAQNFAQERLDSSFLDVLTSSFIGGTILMGVAFLCGFSSIAQPIEFLLPFFKGLGLGASIAQIYISNGGAGVIIALLLIVPNAAIACFAVLFAVKEAIRYSNKYFITGITSKHISGMAFYTKVYCIRFVFFEIIVVFAAVIDAICTFLFASLLLK